MAWTIKKSRWQRLKKKLKSIWASILRFNSVIVSFIANLSGKARHRAVRAKMKKADIILVSPRSKRLSPIALIYRLVLRNRYIHSMLYLGEGKMIHTTTKRGVMVAKLPHKIYRKDLYTILRVKNLNRADRNRIVEAALSWRAKKLDHAGLVTNVPAKLLGLKKPLMRWEKRRIWCSKLIFKSFLAGGIELVPQNQSENVTSEDLRNSPRLIPFDSS